MLQPELLRILVKDLAVQAKGIEDLTFRQALSQPGQHLQILAPGAVHRFQGRQLGQCLRILRKDRCYGNRLGIQLQVFPMEGHLPGYAAFRQRRRQMAMLLQCNMGIAQVYTFQLREPGELLQLRVLHTGKVQCFRMNTVGSSVQEHIVSRDQQPADHRSRCQHQAPQPKQDAKPFSGFHPSAPISAITQTVNVLCNRLYYAPEVHRCQAIFPVLLQNISLAFFRRICYSIRAIRFFPDSFLPVCWNGRRGGLKILWWQHRVGSSPTTGTKPV